MEQYCKSLWRETSNGTALTKPGFALVLPGYRQVPIFSPLWLETGRLFCYSVICFSYYVASALRLILKGKMLNLLGEERPAFCTRDTGSFNSCFMYSEESIRIPLLIKKSGRLLFSFKDSNFTRREELGAELSPEEGGGGEGGEGIEYFRLMSPSVELWQAALKAEGCRSWSATSGRRVCLYLHWTYF